MLNKRSKKVNTYVPYRIASKLIMLSFVVIFVKDGKVLNVGTVGNK